MCQSSLVYIFGNILCCFSVNLRLSLVFAWFIVSLFLAVSLSTGLSASLEIIVLTTGSSLYLTCRGTVDLIDSSNQVECSFVT